MARPTVCGGDKVGSSLVAKGNPSVGRAGGLTPEIMCRPLMTAITPKVKVRPVVAPAGRGISGRRKGEGRGSWIDLWRSGRGPVRGIPRGEK